MAERFTFQVVVVVDDLASTNCCYESSNSVLVIVRRVSWHVMRYSRPRDFDQMAGGGTRLGDSGLV